jgi:hypothetical protein
VPDGTKNKREKRMGFAVIHIEKGTAGKAGGLGAHISRTKNVLNANPELSQFNTRIKIDGDMAMWTTETNPVNLQKRIDDRIREGYTGKTAVRKDAVTHLNIVMTGSHDDMIRLQKEGKLSQWAFQNLGFTAARFGVENIVDFTLHQDEHTPHIHCVVVPLTADGRLSAKEVMGNREKLSDLQEQYGKVMEQFNLDRGIKGSTATHDSVKEFYARVNSSSFFPKVVESNPGSFQLRGVEMPPRIVMNPDEWRKAQNEAIFGQIKAEIQKRDEWHVKTREEVLKQLRIDQTKAINEAMRLRKENAQLKGMVKEQDKQLHPENYIKQEQNQERSRGLRR